MNNFLLEFAGHLHNYVASVMPLVDHTRRLKGKVSSDELGEEYEEKREEILDHYSVELVQGLREYAQHFDLPPVSVSVFVESPKSKEVKRIKLSR